MTILRTGAKFESTEDRAHTEFYAEYMDSTEWQEMRETALIQAGRKCERCGAIESLQVHHLTYEHLGDELPEELLVVCPPCHEKEDRLREERTQETLYAHRLNGWATKVYGQYWEEDRSWEEVTEAFDRWVEDRTERNK